MRSKRNLREHIFPLWANRLPHPHIPPQPSPLHRGTWGHKISAPGGSGGMFGGAGWDLRGVGRASCLLCSCEVRSQASLQPLCWVKRLPGDLLLTCGWGRLLKGLPRVLGRSHSGDSSEYRGLFHLESWKYVKIGQSSPLPWQWGRLVPGHKAGLEQRWAGARSLGSQGTALSSVLLAFCVDDDFSNRK